MNNHKSMQAFERNPSATAAGAGAEGVVVLRRDHDRRDHDSLSEGELESIGGGALIESNAGSKSIMKQILEANKYESDIKPPDAKRFA